VSSTALVAIQPVADAPVPVDLRLLRLKQMVVDVVTAANSKPNCFAKPTTPRSRSTLCKTSHIRLVSQPTVLRESCRLPSVGSCQVWRIFKRWSQNFEVRSKRCSRRKLMNNPPILVSGRHIATISPSQLCNRLLHNWYLPPHREVRWQ